MQIHLRSVLDHRVYTLEVEGNTTYEDIVEMLMGMKIGLLTTNPMIFIERRELEPGMKCVDIDVKRESGGQVIDPRPPPAHRILRPLDEWLDVLPLARKLEYEKMRFQDELKNKNEAIRERDEAIRGRDEAIRELAELKKHMEETKTRDFQEGVATSRKKEYAAAQSRHKLNSEVDLKGGYRKRSKTRKIKRKGRRRKSGRH